MEESLVSLAFGSNDLSMCLKLESDFACYPNCHEILTQITFRKSANTFFGAMNDSFPQSRSFNWRLDFSGGFTNDHLGLTLTLNSRDLSFRREPHLFFSGQTCDIIPPSMNEIGGKEDRSSKRSSFWVSQNDFISPWSSYNKMSRCPWCVLHATQYSSILVSNSLRNYNPDLTF